MIDTAPPPPWVVSAGVRYVGADVRDEPAIADAVAGADVVLHAAFASPLAPRAVIDSVNVDGTDTVRRAALAAGARRMILVSSTIVSAPRRRHPLLRDSPLARLDAYRSARRAAEANAVSTADRLPVAIVRPKTFVGPGRVGGFALIMDAVRRGASVPLIDGGRTSYQLLDVRDLAVALVLVTASDATGVFELGAHRFGTMAEDVGALDHTRGHRRADPAAAAPPRACRPADDRARRRYPARGVAPVRGAGGSERRRHRSCRASPGLAGAVVECGRAASRRTTGTPTEPPRARTRRRRTRSRPCTGSWAGSPGPRPGRAGRSGGR